MRVDQFDFDLPEERIALRPITPRDTARLLVVHPGGERRGEDLIVRDLPSLLRPGDALVLNDTKVIPAELKAARNRNENVAHVSITLHQRVDAGRWRAFARPAKRLKAGDRLHFDVSKATCLMTSLGASVVERGEAGEVLISFDRMGRDLDCAIDAVGDMPLPPYIASKRATDDKDVLDYQTIYARNEGAVAAPTAGLHFTPKIFDALDRLGLSRHFVTLHVGAGTFLPVKSEDTTAHIMHREKCTISASTAEALNDVRAGGSRVVAVGTTSLRVLEAAATSDGIIHPFSGETDIFITPGYQFKAVDLLLTNFHLPRSTLFMLVSAFSGLNTMRSAYAHAIANGYRFYSYGDACLLHPFKDLSDEH